LATKTKPQRGNKAAATGELWDVVRCARYLGRSPWWLYTNVGKDGGPPAVKVGRAVKFRPAEIEAWLDAHAVRPQAAHPAEHSIAG
jgi:predicted DNA-binding transcriptional regulator AlpA